MTVHYEMSAELYRKNADECRERATRALTSQAKEAWLRIAEEWQKLSREMETVEANRGRPDLNKESPQQLGSVAP